MPAEVAPIRCQVGESFLLLDLAKQMREANSLDELAQPFLRGLANLTGASATLLFLRKLPLPMESFFQLGLAPEMASAVADLCEERLCRLPPLVDPPPQPLTLPPSAKAWLYLYPLQRGEGNIGLVGVLKKSLTFSDPMVIKKALSFLACSLDKMIDRLEYEKQLNKLNTYLSIRSLITRALNLRDVLETILHFCLESFGVEAASILLLDDEKKNFRFYRAEGPAKPVLLTGSLPSDLGLARLVLASQQAEVINDVQRDPRFFRRFDQESGFVTRNIIAIPLTAGEEKIGVLQILNKLEGDFYEEELLFLQTVSEEIAFAIRNSELFEVMVKSHCKMLMGQNNCRDCQRPLRSWQPCAKYREEAGLL